MTEQDLLSDYEEKLILDRIGPKELKVIWENPIYRVIDYGSKDYYLQELMLFSGEWIHVGKFKKTSTFLKFISSD